jgi:hypothetical protein
MANITNDAVSNYPRTWSWADGPVSGRYVGMSTATVDGVEKVLMQLKLETDEVVTIWLDAAALRSKVSEELRKRKDGDFSPGELISIDRGASKVTSQAGRQYWPFPRVEFEHAVKRSAAEILLADDDPAGGAGVGDDIPF